MTCGANGGVSGWGSGGLGRWKRQTPPHGTYLGGVLAGNRESEGRVTPLRQLF